MSFAWPLAPAAYVGANAVIFVYFAWGKKLEALATLATIAAGALAYRWFRDRGD